MQEVVSGESVCIAAAETLQSFFPYQNRLAPRLIGCLVPREEVVLWRAASLRLRSASLSSESLELSTRLAFLLGRTGDESEDSSTVVDAAFL